jgi:hypothetical protein
MLKTFAMFGLISVTLMACQNNETSNSEVLATETVVDEDLSSIEIKHDLCDLIEASYYPNNSIDCSKVNARVVKKFESNTTLTMMDIVAKNDRYTCTARSKLVLAGQHVDQNGDIVNTPSSWKTSLDECTTNDVKAHLEAIADAANIANGDAGVMAFDIQNFKYIEAVKELEKALVNETDADSCKFVTTRSTQGSLDNLDNNNFGDSAASELKKLKDLGKIKHIISRSWDGSSGDSEYCSYYYFDIYTIDGQHLYLHYNHTT